MPIALPKTSKSKKEDIPLSELASKQPRKSYIINAELDETMKVLQGNMQDLMERGEKVAELREKSEALSTRTDAFKKRAQQVRRVATKRYRKWKLVAWALVVTVMVVLVVSGLIFIAPFPFHR